MFEGTPLEVGVLFGFGGTPKTRGQLAKEEFGTGMDHIMQAAQYAAGGVGSAVGPKMHNMRSMISPAAGRVRTAASSGWDSTMGAFGPMVAAAREGAREATEAALSTRSREAKRRKKEEQVKQRRIGVAVGLLTAGVAVGAATALVVRRRRRSAWEEYDASEALESMMESVGDRAAEAKGKAADLAEKAAGMAGGVKETASEMGQKTGDATQRMADKTGETAQKAADRTSETAQKAADKTGQTAQKAGDRFADTRERMR